MDGFDYPPLAWGGALDLGDIVGLLESLGCLKGSH
jgi:hypothetical protein